MFGRRTNSKKFICLNALLYAIRFWNVSIFETGDEKWVVWRYWIKLFNQKVLCHLLGERIAGTYWPTQQQSTRLRKVFRRVRSVQSYPPSSQTSVSMLIQAGLILLLWRGLQLGFLVISGWVSSMPSSSSIISDDDSDIELFFKCWPAKQTRNGVRSSAAGVLLQFQKPLQSPLPSRGAR